MPGQELDVRPLSKPGKHPAIFQAYDALPVGGSFVLVSNHAPARLRDEFDTEHPGGYGWDYLGQGPGEWRIRISKLASTSLPRILAELDALELRPGALTWLPRRSRRQFTAGPTGLSYLIVTSAASPSPWTQRAK